MSEDVQPQLNEDVESLLADPNKVQDSGETDLSKNNNKIKNKPWLSEQIWNNNWVVNL